VCFVGKVYLMDRSEKIAFVESFSDSISNHSCMIVVRHTGIDSQSMNDLRRSSRSENVSFRVVKNSLLKLSIQKDVSDIASHVKGSIGVFLSQDPVAASRVISNFAKKKKEAFVPLVGVVSGEIVSAKDVSILATLPSLDQMRSILLRTLLAPATSLVRILQAPHSSLARVMSLYNQKNA
jgi:large subunit ribosomal protein L10